MKRVFLLIVGFVLLGGVMAVSAQDSVDITVRCKASPPEENWRCDNFSEVEAQVEQELGININLNLIQDNIGWGDYKNEFVLASEAGDAPDIVLTGHEDIGAWAASGIIMPLDDMIAEHPEFNDVVPSLWNAMKYQGVTYGVPQDAEARPIFYSKLLLSDLGWSQEEIDSLPDRVRSGEYTFQDMIATAKEAVDEGVVEEGNGFWHRNSNGPDFLYFYYGMGGQVIDDEGNLVFDTAAAEKVYDLFAQLVDEGVTRRDMLGLDGNTIINPGIANADTVVFTAGGTWNWPNFALNYVADKGGNDYLTENLGLMLIPAMETGSAITLTHPLAYLVSSTSEHPDVAMALIAAVTTPEANNRHAIDSFHLGILTTQVDSEAYQANPLLSGSQYMLDYTTSLPNNPGWSSWSEAYYTGIQAVESGDLSPADAVQTVVQQLQNELGDQVVIK